MSDVDAILESLTGRQVPGGCDTCDACQTVRQDPEHPNLWHCTVHHDDACPTYLAMPLARSDRQ